MGERPERTDALIIGGGLMGAASAWALTRRGLSVRLVEQFELGHNRGSSHGSARIVRRAYGDSLYTQLSGRTFELWRELEAASGVNILRILGGLDFGSARDVAAVAARLADVGAAHEVLDADEAERRWPGMRFTGQVVFHPEAGTMDAARAVTAMLEVASRGGAVIDNGVAATALRDDGAGVVVSLSDGTQARADVAVVAAGGWVGSLLDGVVELPPLRVTQQSVFHFPRLDLDAPPWPSVIHDEGEGIYHLAGGRDGGPGDDRKIGEHYSGIEATPDTRDGVVDDASGARLTEYVKRWLPGLDPSPRFATTCLYTTTPSEDFILDRVGHIVVASPCSGHGAKFAPVVGEFVTGLVTGDAVPPERFTLASHLTRAPGRVSL